MKPYKYDFHIHTAASPCGDELMSPQNIVHMALINELDVIAITDHNTCINCGAVMEVGDREGLVVIPGMELECIEEFHSIALFPDLKSAQEMEEMVKPYFLPIKNRPEIFGSQLILSADDEELGEVERLLISAIQLPATTIYKWVRSLGGIIYPAHIDRNSYSVLSNLGAIPEELDAKCVEISTKGDSKAYEKYMPLKARVIKSSDAHYLEQICHEHEWIELNRCMREDVIWCLNGQCRKVCKNT